MHLQCRRIVGSWAQARAAAHPQSAHDHPVTKRSKRARLRQTVGHDEHQRASFKERWACSACVASTAPICDARFVRCVHPRTYAAPWETPTPLAPLCSAVGQRARSERVASTLDPSVGLVATIKCWHALGVHARQGFVRGERRGTVARRAGRRLEYAPRVRSQGAAPARLGLDSRSRTKTRVFGNCSAAFFGVVR